MEISEDEDYKQSNKAGRTENEVEDGGCNDNVNRRNPEVIKVHSCIVKTVNIICHQINNLADAGILS